MVRSYSVWGDLVVFGDGREGSCEVWRKSHLGSAYGQGF